MERELITEFANNNFTLHGDDTAAQCASLCISFGLTPPELTASWEVFYLNSRLDDGKVQSSQLDKFKQFLQNEQKEALRRKQNDIYLYSKNEFDMFDSDDETGNISQKLPLAGRSGHPSSSMEAQMDVDYTLVAPKTPAPVTINSARKFRSESSPITPFSQRSNKYTVQSVLNNHLPEALVEQRSNVASEDDILRRLRPIGFSQVNILGLSLKPGCRFMYDRTEDRFVALEKRIKFFADILANHESSSVCNHVALASQERVFVVGMVCCDGEGHLNDKSLLLQGSVEHSGGHRVRLDVGNVPHFSLFPGQIIGIEGYNPSGHCLVASRLVDSVPFPCYSMSVDSIEPSNKRQATESKQLESSISQGPSSISMVIAGGPFTTSDNLAFEPFVELLAFSRKKRPNVLLLMGPFVDSEHPQIRLGTVDRSCNQIFQDEIKARVEEYCEEMGSGARVVLVPSTRDAHHDFLFPQPPFDGYAFNDPGHQITVLANPGIFQVNKITIGCCTIDILRHLSSEEVSRVPAGVSSDRLARLANHLIGQQSFYPLFPSASGVPLDLSLSLGSLTLPCQPDILILSSDLAPFVKVLPSASENAMLQNEGQLHPEQIDDKKIGSCICINPGRLAKGMNGGTFADLFTFPLSEGISGGEQALQKRTRISIIKI